MHLKSQPWFVWRRLGECSCHPHLSSHSLRNLSPSLSQAATDSDTQPCWSLSEPSTCLAGSCADGERHFSQLRDTAVQSSSLGGSITVTWAGDPVTHTQDKIDRNVKVRIKLKVFFFSHLLHKCITYLSLFFCKQKKSVYNPTLQRPSSNLSAGLHLPLSLSPSLFTRRRSVCSTRANTELCRAEENPPQMHLSHSRWLWKCPWCNVRYCYGNISSHCII